ncbi:MAG: S1C family serine protease [Actinomycetes bacterium]
MTVVSISAVLLMGACSSGGGGDASSSAASAGASAKPSAAASGSPAAAGAISSYQKAQPAVVQIAAEGEYRDVGMAEGQQGAWMGSGFIIDPSGLAVTNAHVAEGAATLKVYVGGSKEPINAKILGISECDDLAVIDLAGDGFPFLVWHKGPVDVTTKVWAAGFPLGDPQYTVTDGTVAKNNADGQREWASLDYVLESTANIQHGNSGGPLLAEDGSVVGINYAGGAADATAAAQFWAIPAALAQPIVDELKTGKDVDSIGVNGTAFYDDKSSLGGIWVSGVRSGSPAGEAGLQAGDVITKLEGRDAVSDADVDTSGGLARVTKAGYCNVLKTQGTEHPIKIQVFRSGTGEVLEGEVNNADKPLKAISALNNTSGGQDGSSASPSDSAAPASDVTYSNVSDDTGAISVDVPSAWDQVNTAKGDGFGQITATGDAQGFSDGTAAGVEFYAFDGDLKKSDLKSTMKKLEEDKTIGALIATCKDSEAGKVQTGEGYSYVGNSYWNCKGSDESYYLSIRTYPDKSKFVILDAQFTTDADVEMVNRSLASLVVN